MRRARRFAIVTLAGLALAAPGAPAAAAPPAIVASFELQSQTNGRGTRIDVLAVDEIPAAMQARLRCRDRPGYAGRPRGCPLRLLERRFDRARARHDFAPRLELRRLRPGTAVSLEIAAPGATGKLLRIEVLKARLPRVTLIDPTPSPAIIGLP